MQRLQNDGLVVIVPRQGTGVSPFTVDDVRDLFDVRESIEVVAARLAAERADAAGLRGLRGQLDAARLATAAQDTAAIAAANAGFHRMVIEVARNPLLQSLMRPLEARGQWLFHLTNQRDPGQQHVEHEELYDAIAEHDVERAARCAFAHTASGRLPSMELARSWATDTVDPVEATRTRRR